MSRAASMAAGSPVRRSCRYRMKNSSTLATSQRPALTHCATSMPSSVEYIRSGRMRALGLSTAKRSQALPDVPTIGETVPGYESSPIYGIGAPKGTPPEIVDLLNREINAGLADAKLNARLADLGGMMLPGSATDFGRLIADETDKWGRVIRAANIKSQ